MSDTGTKSPPTGLSRRGFMKGVGAGGVATGLIGPAATPNEAAAQADTAPLRGPGEIPVTLRVNGESRDLQVDTRTTLLDALHDR